MKRVLFVLAALALSAAAASADVTVTMSMSVNAAQIVHQRHDDVLGQGHEVQGRHRDVGPEPDDSQRLGDEAAVEDRPRHQADRAVRRGDGDGDAAR